MTIREDLWHNDYEIYEERKSQIDPTKTINVQKGMMCPSCKKFIPVVMAHGSTLVCDCGLKMTLYGNRLECEL